MFPLAEQGTFDGFKRYRKNGCRVSGQMLRILMKSNVKLKYGNAAAGHFTRAPGNGAKRSVSAILCRCAARKIRKVCPTEASAQTPS